METIPGYAEPFPPPPPPQRSRKGLWIGLGIGAVVLCLCCIVVAVGGFLFRQTISNFIYTRSAQLYENPDAGISLYYPKTWQYNVLGDPSYGYQIILSSSPDNLTLNDVPKTGADMLIMTDNKASDLTIAVDASSMGDVVDYLATNLFSSSMGQAQNLHTFNLSGYPAASISSPYCGARRSSFFSASALRPNGHNTNPHLTRS